jgi:hypothetical protein
VDAKHGVVVTYSSCLALLYFANDDGRLTLEDIARNARHSALYDALSQHAGIGLIAALDAHGVHVQSRVGRARIVDGVVEVLDGGNPLTPYGTDPLTVRAIESLVRQPNAGDLVLFGAYDGYEIVSFDDQIGAHGSAGRRSGLAVPDRAWGVRHRERAHRERAGRSQRDHDALRARVGPVDDVLESDEDAPEPAVGH